MTTPTKIVLDKSEILARRYNILFGGIALPLSAACNHGRMANGRAPRMSGRRR